jgi:tetratricopeptide (TPR) repeat protein
MLRSVFRVSLVVVLLAVTAAAQRGGGHILYGDLRVDASQASVPPPNVFYVMLVSPAVSSSERRQPVSPGGRYRFLEVTNGAYDLVVESEGQEVGRLRLLIQDFVKTDIRQDIDLVWSDSLLRRNKASVVSALYLRKRDNQKLFDQAFAASEKQQFEEAVALLKQLLASDPKDFVAWTLLGAVYAKLNRPGEASDAYRRALVENKEYLTAWLDLGSLHLAQKSYVELLRLMAQALRLRPDSAKANYLAGEAYLGLKQGNYAAAFLNEALRLDPDGMAEVHLRLAMLYHAAGYKDLAAAEYEKFLAKRPDYPQRAELERYIKENKHT